jgi:ribosomal protein S17E
MGKIKSKMMRKASREIMKEDVGVSKDFEHNKTILGNTMPSKRMRNKIAGLLSRMKRQEEKKKKELE